MEYIETLWGLLSPETHTFLIALFISVFLGYIMGAERELRGKDAGISTHIFVIAGAMIFTLMSGWVDPASESRIAAQIVSGIGFLGAGLILKDGANVKNLTTAASIWFAGAIGMTIGFGYYAIALIAGFVGVFIPRIRHFQNQVGIAQLEIAEKPKRKPKKL